MKSTIAIAACAALGLSTFAAEAATIAKKPHARHSTAAAKPEAAPEAAPADPAPAKVIEPDPVYYGHAGSGTKYPAPTP